MATRTKKTVESTTETNSISNDVIVVSHMHRDIAFILPQKKRVTINGTSKFLRGKEMGVIPVGTATFTKVKKEDWEYIIKTWAKFEPFVNGLIYASKDESSAKDESRDKKELRDGFEPVDTTKTTTKENTDK